jgi:glyoxylase-like metal-dependent hydrolase (beta-lactamase superfamily II)
LNTETITEVKSGLYQIRLPIPIRSLGYVFVYFIKNGDHSLLIDTGWPSDECFDALKESLGEIGSRPNQIDQIVVSHLHPDHFGLAEQLKEMNRDSKLIMHQADASLILERYEDYQGFTRELHEWLAVHGAPNDELKAMIDASSEMLNFFRPPKPNVIVSGGERLNVGKDWSFEVVPTPGHTIGTICLYERNGSKILFSGDHILPTITPNVSLGPFYRGDPLGDYLNSLETVDRLEVETVLPSHEYIFSDLRKRVQEIKKHHEQRLNECLSVLEDNNEGRVAMSGYQVASKLHWYSGAWEKLGAWERRAALMETLAHLEYLKRKGKVTEISELGEDGKPHVEYAVVGAAC